MNTLTVQVASVQHTDRCDAGFIDIARVERILKTSGDVKQDERLVELTFSSKGIRYIVEKAPIKP